MIMRVLKQLKNINLELTKGEVLAVVGPSGGGKSTLLRVIAGLEKAKTGEMFFRRQALIWQEKFCQSRKARHRHAFSRLCTVSTYDSSKKH